MEYLMSYGWAVLVVLVVGVTLWQLGVINIGSSSAPTSSGFDTIKPFLNTCTYQNNINNWGGWMGFQCEFVNGGASTAFIDDVSFYPDGGHCQYSYAATNFPPTIPPRWMLIWSLCSDPDLPCTFEDGTRSTIIYDSTCRYCLPASPCGGGFCQTDSVRVAPGETVLVGAITAGNEKPCIKSRGDKVAINTEIIYNVTLGASTIRKRSVGVVHMTV